MNPLPQYSDELDVLEHDISSLRVLVDAAVEHHDVDTARALSGVIDDRKARLARVMRAVYRRQQPASGSFEQVDR